MKLYIDTKPTLEWVEHGIRCYEAQDYLIEPSRNKSNGSFLFRGESAKFLGDFDTLEAAKAAAQADYERRTAERFREVELPEALPDKPTILTAKSFINGYNCAVGDIHANTQSAIGAGEGEL